MSEVSIFLEMICHVIFDLFILPTNIFLALICCVMSLSWQVAYPLSREGEAKRTP